jgi:hypothetical protein
VKAVHRFEQPNSASHI